MPKVMLVEDEKMIRKLIASKLAGEGYEVIQASNGLEALEKIQQDTPDLIVSDISMPKMDGVKFFEELRSKSDSYLTIPFIFLTAHADEGLQLSQLQQGAIDYITKPIKLSLLVARIDSILQFQNTQVSVLRGKLEAVLGESVDEKQITDSEFARFEAALSKHKDLLDKPINQVFPLNGFQSITLNFNEISEVDNIVGTLSLLVEDKDSFIIGLKELIINSLEHGLYEIGYKAKSQLIKDNIWLKTLEEKSVKIKAEKKFAQIFAEMDGDNLFIRISDFGEGFNPSNYMDFDPLRFGDTHGRGIAMARAIAFPDMKYLEGGSVVEASYKRKKASAI